jgi:DNA modification methylase
VTVEILIGDCREQLRTLPERSVQTCVTSPPYFGLRDYGVDGQMGLEPTPDEFVAGMVAVFREVRRVLADDGTLWLNLGDSYASDSKWGGSTGGKSAKALHGDTGVGRGKRATGLPDKNLIGIPWRVALALQADGWILRQDIIWHKPSPMPESVTDRCTKAHEYIFLMSKSPRYYFDGEAIKEPSSRGWAGSSFSSGKTATHQMGKAQAGDRPQAKRAMELAHAAGLTEAHIAAIRSVGISDVGKALTTTNGAGKNDPAIQALAAEAKGALGGYYREFLMAEKRNKRSVWTVATKPFKGAHFATFPPDLIEPCILAGCPVGGTVLDPFFGTGTTGLVASRLGRNAIGIELNPEYAAMARSRIDAPPSAKKLKPANDNLPPAQAGGDLFTAIGA